MRSLQRIRHRLPPETRDVGQIRRWEGRSLSESRRAKRLAHLRLIVLLIVPTSAIVTFLWLWSRRVVAEGLVSANTVEVRAPADVRVREVLVEPGRFVRSGDPLLVLEALETEERPVLLAEVEEHRLRLELARAGGELGSSVLGRRVDDAQRAELEAFLADAALETAQARLSTLGRERERLAIELEQDRERAAGARRALGERVAGSLESVAQESTLERLAGYEAGVQERLLDEGVAAERASVTAAAQLDAQRHATRESGAEFRALEREFAGLETVEALEEERAAAALAEVDARMDIERRLVAAEALRRERWTTLSAWRRELLPAEEVPAGRLRELELGLFAAELGAAEARLAALDARLGNTTLTAQAEGVVDMVHVRPGAVVVRDAPLLSHYDPRQITILAYAEPADVAALRAGADCEIRIEGHRERLEGEVDFVGATWVQCPRSLARERTSRTDLRLPFGVTHIRGEARQLLRPNTRVEVVVRRSAAGEAPEPERGG